MDLSVYAYYRKFQRQQLHVTIALYMENKSVTSCNEANGVQAYEVGMLKRGCISDKSGDFSQYQAKLILYGLLLNV